jgi:hypothetical protein
MVVCDSSCLISGGYDGSSASSELLRIDLRPVQQLQRSSLEDLVRCMACCGSSTQRGQASTGAPKAGAGGGGRGGKAGLVLLPDTAAAAADSDSAGEAEQDEDSGSTLKAVRVAPAAAVLQVPPVMKALSKKATPPPLQLSDLPNAEEVAAMPQWKQVRQLHQVRGLEHTASLSVHV